MKMFISLPMRGRSNEEIGKDISRVEKFLIKKLKEVLPSVNADCDLVFVHNLECPKPEVKNEPVGYLAIAIHELANCDALVRLFPATRYGKTTGCNIEQSIADNYGIPVIQIRENHTTHELSITDIFFRGSSSNTIYPANYRDEDECSY